MKKTLLFIFVITSLVNSFSQNRKGDLFISNSSSTHTLYISFDLTILKEANFNIQNVIASQNELQSLVNQYQLTFQTGIPIEADTLEKWIEKAQQRNGNSKSVEQLKTIYKIVTPHSSNEKLFEIGTALEQLETVTYCHLESHSPIRPPVTDIPPATPNFVSEQTYIQANPGVNMQYAWNLGFTAQGISLKDIEYGFNKNHEEFAEANAFLADGMTVSSDAFEDYTEHGTGVFGILFGQQGTFGVTGLAYGAQELILYPEWQETGYNRITAVAEALEDSEEGHVVVYEMQADGPGVSQFDYVPAEFNQIVWDLTKAATDLGVIIVAAAGNGNQNLDATAYQSYMNRGDSGAIIVGAGTPNLQHNRISYSTFGSRVNLQAWGDNVRSTGKILDYILIGNDFNQSYTIFTGTSSATPIVASCAAVLLSYYRSLTNGANLSSQEIRQILMDTGIPQGTGVAGNIGPIPNMQTAMNAVFALNTIKNNTVFAFTVYPNPANDVIQLLFSNENSIADASIFDVSGKLIKEIKFSGENNEQISISDLAKGLYFIRIAHENGVAIQKFVKQ